MFGLGTTEIVIILVLALLLFGPQKLPEIGKQIGGMLREFRNMTGDVQRALDLDNHNDYDNGYSHRNSYEYGYKSDNSYASLPSAPQEEEQAEKSIAPFAYSAPTTGTPIASTATVADAPEHASSNDTAAESDKVVETAKNETTPETSGAARVYNEPEASDTEKVALDATAKKEETI